MTGRSLKERLLKAGAAVVGLAVVKDALEGDIRHLPRAVSIGLSGNLREHNLSRLGELQKLATSFLKKRGYRTFCIPPDSDRINGTFASKLYPLFTHKVAATCSGLGWIGRNGLLINPVYGPKLSLATVLTDAPFEVDKPIEASKCGDCALCVDHCPSEAITGEDWSRDDPFPALIDIGKCRTHKGRARSLRDRPNCGLCISICPYGRSGDENMTG